MWWWLRPILVFSLSLSQAEQNHKYMMQLANTIKFNTRILASSQAAPVVVSMAIGALKTAAKSNNQIQSILRALIDGDQTPGDRRKATPPILERIDALVTSPDSWPSRQRYTINMIFDTNEIRKFSSITENYLNKKASKEVEHFISPKVLSSIAV